MIPTTTLHLPRRAAKPRDTGLTMILDGGIPLWYFTDLVSSAGRGPRRREHET